MIFADATAVGDPFTTMLNLGGQAGITLAILWWVTQRLVPRLIDDTIAARTAFTEALERQREAIDRQSAAISELAKAVLSLRVVRRDSGSEAA